MARRAWAAFGRLLKERPLLTNMAVSGLTMTTGDLTAQALERRAQHRARRAAAYDPGESFVSLVVGSFRVPGPRPAPAAPSASAARATRAGEIVPGGAQRA